jgi:chemotaxis response regulator CheB
LKSRSAGQKKQKMRKFFIPVFLLISLGSSAQEQNMRTKEEQRMFEEKKQKQEEADRLGRERHQKMQTKKVRKRMKQSSKKARKVNEPRKEFFLFRLFRRN